MFLSQNITELNFLLFGSYWCSPPPPPFFCDRTERVYDMRKRSTRLDAIVRQTTSAGKSVNFKHFPGLYPQVTYFSPGKLIPSQITQLLRLSPHSSAATLVLLRSLFLLHSFRNLTLCLNCPNLTYLLTCLARLK